MQTIETKVIASTAGSGAGAAVASFALWLLGVMFFGAPAAADHAGAAVGAVPSPVSVLVGVTLTAVGGFVTGYAAPHTGRADALTDPAPGRHATDAPTEVVGSATLPPTDDLNSGQYAQADTGQFPAHGDPAG